MIRGTADDSVEMTAVVIPSCEHGLQLELMEREMKFVVYEPCSETRALLCEHLSALGFGVAPFGDARVAFLFLLGRLHEIDGAIVNVGDLGEGPWLMQRIRLLGEPLAVVTYCGEVDGEGDAIERSLYAAFQSSDASGTAVRRRQRTSNSRVPAGAPFAVTSTR